MEMFFSPSVAKTITLAELQDTRHGDVQFAQECLENMLEVLATSLTELDEYDTSIPVKEVENLSLALTIVKYAVLTEEGMTKFADVISDILKLLIENHSQNPVFMFNDLDHIEWDKPITYNYGHKTPRQMLTDMNDKISLCLTKPAGRC